MMYKMNLFVLISLVFCFCTNQSEKLPSQESIKDASKGEAEVISVKPKEVPVIAFENTTDDSVYISNHVFDVNSIKKNKNFSVFKITESNDEQTKFNSITKNNYSIKGTISNIEDLHTAHFICTSNDFNSSCLGKDCVPFYLKEIKFLSEILFKDTEPIKLIECSLETEYTESDVNNRYQITTRGGNFNEITVIVTHLKYENIVIEFVVRDIGDLMPYKYGCK